MESKRTVHKGNACSFRHDENKRGKVTQSSISVSRAPTQNDGEVLSKRISQGRSPSGKRSGRPCKNDIRGNCTNP